MYLYVEMAIAICLTVGSVVECIKLIAEEII